MSVQGGSERGGAVQSGQSARRGERAPAELLARPRISRDGIGHALRVGFVLLAALVAPASAFGAFEKMPYSADELREIATHVAVGTIERIELRRTLEGGYEYERFAATLSLETFEKVEKDPNPPLRTNCIAPSSTLDVRYWTRRWVAPTAMPADTNGHDPLPRVGARVRAYLVNAGYNGFGETTDGRFDVVGRNGWEILEEPKTLGSVDVAHDWRVRAGIGSAAIALAVTLVLIARRRRRARAL